MGQLTFDQRAALRNACAVLGYHHTKSHATEQLIAAFGWDAIHYTAAQDLSSKQKAALQEARRVCENTSQGTAQKLIAAFGKENCGVG